MRTLLCLVTLVAMVTRGQAAGAGRAFPLLSENYAIDQFQRVNKEIEWDSTNFLVDLSGTFANCARAGERTHETIDRKTQEGASIAAVIDYTQGSASDVNAVNGYVTEVLDRWVRDGTYNAQIRSADSFGCSVRPACRGEVVIACLFSPSSIGFGEIEDPAGEQNALAFTQEQYDLAETMVGNKWDRSHFLENLSGFETQCSMIDSIEWSFAYAQAEARKRGMRVTGLYGDAVNRGSTQAAMQQILAQFKEIRTASEVGCSVIPDCGSNRGDIHEMFVVVSCIYQES